MSGVRERETRHRLGRASPQARADCGAVSTNGIAAPFQPPGSLCSSSYSFFSPARPPSCVTSASGVGGPHAATPVDDACGAEYATAAPRRHSYGAQAVSPASHPLPSRPPPHRITYSDSAPQCQTSLSVATATLPKVDAGTAEKSYTSAGTCGDSSASSIDRLLVLLNPAPSKTTGAEAARPTDATGTPSVLISGRVKSLLSRARIALGGTSAARESSRENAHTDSCEIVPLSENAHPSCKDVSPSPSPIVKGHHHRPRYEEADEEKHSGRSSTGQRNASQKSSLAAGACADHPTMLPCPSQLSAEKLSESAAGSAGPWRRASTSAIPFGPSSMGVLTRSPEAVFSSVAAAATTEASYSPERSSSSPTATRRESCMRHSRPSLLITSGSPKAMNAAMPSVRLIYTRSSGSSKARSPEKRRSLLVSAAKDVLSDGVHVAAAASTESATATEGVSDLTVKGVHATTATASAQLSLGAQLPLRRSSLAQQNESGHLSPPSASIPLARNFTNAGVHDRVPKPAALSPSEGCERVADEKCGDASGKDTERTANGAFRPASARDADEAPQSYLTRWRQRQEESRLKAKGVEPISVSSSPDIESSTIHRAWTVKDAVSAVAKEGGLRLLPSVPAPNALWRQQKGREPPSARTTSAANDLTAAPQAPAKEPVRQRRQVLTVDAETAATVCHTSDSVRLGELMHGSAVPHAPDAALALGEAQPKPPSATQSRSAIVGAAAAVVRNRESQARMTTSVSAHISSVSSFSSCYLAEDAAHQAAGGEGVAEDLVVQSPQLHDPPMGAMAVNPPRPPSARPTACHDVASEAAAGADPTRRRPSGCASSHCSARREITGGSMVTEKDGAAPFQSASAAETRKLFRAALERRVQRLQLQDCARNAGYTSQSSSSMEARAGMPEEAAAVSLDSCRLEQPNARRATTISTTCSSPWKLTQGATAISSSSAESTLSSACADRTVTPEGLSTLHLSTVASPPTELGTDEDAPSIGERAAAETRVEPAFSAGGRGRDRRSSFCTTDTASERTSPRLKSPQCLKNEELADHRSVSRTPGTYTSLLQWIRQNRTSSSRPASGVSETLLAADSTAGVAAVWPTTEIEQNARLARRRALAKKHGRPSRNASDTEGDNSHAHHPGAGASGQALKALSAHKSADAFGSQGDSNSIGSLDTSSFEKNVRSEKQLHLVPAHPSSQNATEGSSIPVIDAELPTHTLTSAVVDGVKGATVTTRALGDIDVSELDKLEQSINALLKNYRHSNAKEKGSAPPKSTAAAARMLEVLPTTGAPTSMDAKHKEATVALKAHVKKGPKHDILGCSNAGENAHTCVYHRCTSETDDGDSQWEASGLWCGDEAAHEAKPPPAFVPPLDLTLLLLPNVDSDDLKRYRIPMPSAVPAPDEAHRNLLFNIGACAVSFGDESNAAAPGNALRAGATAGEPSTSAPRTGEKDPTSTLGGQASVKSLCALPPRRAGKSATPPSHKRVAISK
ncbi:hypothetical protein GH5_01467 [Leishmania sp. Ghana 2012 LV757]|uniref:hypothetical protein n=1 Tax=Leishmania sp. Ghana 2012 LV757 TaxID=2803181 RepID=UPI001B63D817|nr:hypothetical protein GH5_01467 [Leishmania sp. Ghana 2012 LV757]